MAGEVVGEVVGKVVGVVPGTSLAAGAKFWWAYAAAHGAGT